MYFIKYLYKIKKLDLLEIIAEKIHNDNYIKYKSVVEGFRGHGIFSNRKYQVVISSSFGFSKNYFR